MAAFTERDAQLRALLTNDADRARFDARTNESRPSRGPALDDVVNSENRNLFGYSDEQRPQSYRIAISADKQEQGRAFIRTHINDELALYSRAPSAWESKFDARVAPRMRRDVDWRAPPSTEADNEKFDRTAARLRDMSPRKTGSSGFRVGLTPIRRLAGC